jgi:hypothetical protein
MQTFATTAGTSYVVSFDLGYGGDSGLFGGPVKVTASAAGTSATFTSGSGTPNPAVWNSETFTFTATSVSTSLSFVGLSGIDYIGLDNVDVELRTVVTPPSVPEPGTVALVLTGIGFLGSVSRRYARR